jgi:hypothetical protein
MKRYLLILCVVVVFVAASVFVYVPLVARRVIKASGRDQHIVSPLWAKVVFYPAAAIVRYRDLCGFRARYLGTWSSTDATVPYQLTLTSVAFDTATGQQSIGGTNSVITFRDMVHYLYRQPFGEPIMYGEGTDDWFLYFRDGFRHGPRLVLSIPDGPLKDRSRPTRNIPLEKVAAK